MDKGSKDHIKSLLKSGTRLDGRNPMQIRKPFKVEYGLVSTADGSAKVTLGETEVMVGIKMEVGEPYPDIADEGTMIVGAELLPLSNPEFELGPPGIHAIELARIVDRGLRESKAIDFKKLCIKEGELVWTLLVDICPLNDAGNLQDVSAIAALAAMKDAVFPKLEGNKITYKEKTDKHLIVKDDPIAVTVIKIGADFIVDPTIEEESSVESRLTVTSLKDGTLCALQKGEEGALTKEEIMKMIEIGIEKGKEFRGAL